jgi:hypothetical protein
MFYSLPSELKQLIITEFYPQDCNFFRTVSKQCKQEIDKSEHAKICKITEFLKIYGIPTINESVSIDSINSLGNQIHTIEKLKSAEKNNMILTFTNGQPHLISKSSYFNNNWDLLKKHYDLFVDELPGIKKIFESHVNIVQEFKDHHIDSANSTKKNILIIRLIIKRVTKIEDERKLLLNTLSFFHSTNELDKLKLPADVDYFTKKLIALKTQEDANLTLEILCDLWQKKLDEIKALPKWF